MKNRLANSIQDYPFQMDSQALCIDDILAELPDSDVQRLHQFMSVECLQTGERLAAWLSHRINNQLCAISGRAQLLARRIQAEVDDHLIRQAYLGSLDTIREQTERCSCITDEIYDHTRIGEPDLRSIELKSVVTQVQNLANQAYPDSSFEYDISTIDFLPNIIADKRWITRILFELISNAIEASPSGPVKIVLNCLEGDEGRTGVVRISVLDSGPGVPDHLMPRIFDPFFSTKETAMGMGLTISLQMIKKMGGALLVGTSDCGRFMFTAEIPSREAVGKCLEMS